ncbi:MAG: NDP-sugar synthase, partial [Acidobacteriota bacterium]|nr:NDP-sugar synthase [Acidobacteriota bacterium]
VILGTSGALDNARDFFREETFAVVNGKIATDIDLAAALRTHRATGALATLVLRANGARERYSTVNVLDGRVLGFGPAPQASDNARDANSVSQKGAEPHSRMISGSTSAESESTTSEQSLLNEPGVEDASRAVRREVPLMFTGIQILEPRIFDYVPRGVFSHSTVDVYPKAIERGEVIAAHVAGGYWYELSTIRRYLDTSVALMRAQGRSIELGEGSRVEEGARVEDAVLWENVAVEAGARVCGAVIGANVRVPRGEVLEGCAVVRRELVEGSERPPKALEGEARGENFVVKLAR